MTGGTGGTATRQVPLREVMRHYPTGVVVITASGREGPVGLAANSFTSVSLEPPLVLFCAAHTSTTWPAIRTAGAFAVNIPGAAHLGLTERFATRGVDRFEDVAHRPGATGAPLLAGAVAWLDCRITAVHPAGDHDIVIGSVVAATVGADAATPLVFHDGTLRPLT